MTHVEVGLCEPAKNELKMVIMTKLVMGMIRIYFTMFLTPGTLCHSEIRILNNDCICIHCASKPFSQLRRKTGPLKG